MKLVLLRHGVSYSNSGKYTPVQNQNLLSESGVQGVIQSSKLFKEEHPDLHFSHVFSSTYVRAMQTAMNFLSIKENHPVDIQFDSRIVERDYGFTNFIGYHDLIAKRGKEEVESWDNEFDKAPSEHGETQIQVYNRTMEFFEDKVRPVMGDGDILIVAHFYILRALQSHIACGSWTKMNDFLPKNCQPVVYDLDQIKF